MRRAAGPDLGDRRITRVVAAPSEDRLNIPAGSGAFRPMNEFVESRSFMICRQTTHFAMSLPLLGSREYVTE
jgi:hypothetical protein